VLCSEAGAAAPELQSAATPLFCVCLKCWLLVLLQVRFVKGLDLSPREVEEARRRYGELLHKDRGAQQMPTAATAAAAACLLMA
jgi:hypothetical protein